MIKNDYIDLKVKFLGYETEITIWNNATESELKEDTLETLKTAYPEDETLFDDELDLDNHHFEVLDWKDIPEYMQDIDLLGEILEEVRTSGHSFEVFEAGLGLKMDLSDIANNYLGEFKSDSDFAYERALQTNNKSDFESWPFNCIDWNWAAEQLMSDHSTFNGHYFTA